MTLSIHQQQNIREILHHLPGLRPFSALFEDVAAELSRRDVMLAYCRKNPVCSVQWEKVGEPGTRPTIVWVGKPDTDAVAQSRTRMWDLLHELGHVLNATPDRMDRPWTEILERETSAWDRGWIFAMSKDPAVAQFLQEFEARRDDCLGTYRLAAGVRNDS